MAGTGGRRDAEQRRVLVAQARELRRAGRTYEEISAALAISKSTCSLWLRDLPRPQRPAEQARVMSRARWDRVLREREEERQRVRARASDWVGAVTARDLVLAAAVSYWCEGSKDKAWDRRERVVWANTDPGLVLLFLRGLCEIGVAPERVRFRVSLHEHADEPTARAAWAAVVGVHPDLFLPTTLKRHRPAPGRRNTGEGYRGCLHVSVRGSRTLYQALDGIVRGLVTGAGARGGWHDGPALTSVDRLWGNG